MNNNNRLSGVLLPILLLAAALGGCDNRQEKAQAAYAQYQAALVNGDLRAARLALAELVTADDSNPLYWTELAKICLQMSDYGAAYSAFQRAHELNRGDVEVLTAMTQLALRSGSLDVADDNARQLELVAPGNAAVPLTKGYVALQRGDLDEAERQAAALIAAAPYDGSGKVLKSRILMTRDQPDAAIALLREQVSQQPSDAESLKALAGIYELRQQWSEAAAALASYLSYVPKDPKARVRLVTALLRAQQVERAAEVTLKAIDEDDVDSLLRPWRELGRQSALADRLFAWAQSANVGRRIAVARFLDTASQPARVLALTANEATLPVKPTNVVANALYGTALAQTGRTQEGLARLSQVIEVDGTNREALRGRTLLRAEAKDYKQAIEDAQKLVAADDQDASGRLLLARIYAAAGDGDGQRRALWEAFHDLAENESIFDALLPLVAKSDGPQAAARLSQEFYDKRAKQLTRSFA